MEVKLVKEENLRSYQFDSQSGPLKVWFKFGCANLNLTEDGTYVHICNLDEFIEFLQKARELSTTAGESWEQE